VLLFNGYKVSVLLGCRPSSVVEFWPIMHEGFDLDRTSERKMF
jgi:hypothetical protein